MTKDTIQTVYNPKDVEERLYNFWIDKNYFHSEVLKDKKRFTIVIPPPNITGALHMGHALNNTIQDILIRWKRMQGYNSLWLPGTDHAGIATQAVVERQLSKKKIKKHDLGREKFLEEVWKWREEYGRTIITQLKKLGSSCDWVRERFTMDEGLSNAVQEVFIRLYQKGLIYRGNYIVNWCPGCESAISDDEVNHEDISSNLWYIKYPIKDSKDFITVATTRPETMLGDTAVAVNPKDERYKNLVGKIAILPLLNREIPIIADDYVDSKFGTGAVKVTPAHDPNDFQMGQRHNLPSLIVMNTKGKMNENAGEKYKGLDRFKCRDIVIEDLKKLNLLSKIEPHQHAVGHCYRCHSIIEPYLSLQWFVKMKPLAEPGIKVVKEGKIKFHPERWTKVYLDWMENIRDWCISRQLWWGHRIPIWYCQSDNCDGIIASKIKPENACPKCGCNNFKQDEDVLDTWFSSWLWPFSTLGWPEKTPELDYYYPTDVLVTDRNIIFFWVARMIMAGLEFMNDIPFTDVYIHGTVLDEAGRRMSKSLGNGIDPLEMIDKYGSDAVRASLIMLTSEGQDVKLAKTKFEMGRNFCNKIWNAFRFIKSNLPSEIENCKLSIENCDIVDKWILSKYNKTIQKTTQALDNYRFNEAIFTIHDFFWHDFCDWYLEWIKPRLYQSDAIRNPQSAIRNLQSTAQMIALTILKGTIQLLHPFIPFITEEIWQNIKTDNDVESIMISSYPTADANYIDDSVEEKISILQEIIYSVRNIRSEMNVPLSKKSDLVLKIEDDNIREFVLSVSSYLSNLSKVENLSIEKDVEKPKTSASAVTSKGIEVFVPLEGLIDFEVEKNRLKKDIEKITKEVEKLNLKLANEDFLSKAPANVVESTRKQKEEMINVRTKLEESLKKLENL